MKFSVGDIVKLNRGYPFSYVEIVDIFKAINNIHYLVRPVEESMCKKVAMIKDTVDGKNPYCFSKDYCSPKCKKNPTCFCVSESALSEVPKLKQILLKRSK